jgi:hypothetical protein
MNATAKRTRSPAYPYIGLKAAVEKCQELYNYGKRGEVNLKGVFSHWGYSDSSGSAKKVLAALKYFGLVEQPYGSKNVKLTERALRILLDHESSEGRSEALIKAFLSPKMYAYCWNKWKDELPHDDAMKSHLIFDNGFNESIVNSFIADYKQSLQYAEIANSDIINSEDDSEDNDNNVEHIQENQPIKRDRPVMKSGTQQATFPLDEGEVFFQWPEQLSQTSLEDLETWLDLVKRKIERSVKQEAEDSD